MLLSSHGPQSSHIHSIAAATPQALFSRFCHALCLPSGLQTLPLPQYGHHQARAAYDKKSLVEPTISKINLHWMLLHPSMEFANIKEKLSRAPFSTFRRLCPNPNCTNSNHQPQVSPSWKKNTRAKGTFVNPNSTSRLCSKGAVLCPIVLPPFLCSGSPSYIPGVSRKDLFIKSCHIEVDKWYHRCPSRPAQSIDIISSSAVIPRYINCGTLPECRNAVSDTVLNRSLSPVSHMSSLRF